MGIFDIFKKKEPVKQVEGNTRFDGPGFSVMLYPGWELDAAVKKAFVFNKGAGSLRISVFAKQQPSDMQQSNPARFLEDYVKDDFKLSKAPPIRAFGSATNKGALCNLTAKDEFGSGDIFWIVAFVENAGKYALINYNCEASVKKNEEAREAEAAITSLSLQ